MRKFVKYTVISVLAASMAVMPVMASETEEIQEKQEAAEQELAELRDQLAEMITKIDETEQASIDKADEIAACETDIEEAKTKESHQYAAMKLRIKYMYENGGGRIMQAILNSENVADALNKAEYSAEISSYDRMMIMAYIDTQNEIQALEDTKKEEQADLIALKSDFESQKAELDDLIAEKEAEVEDFQAQYNLAVQMALARDAELQAVVAQAIETGNTQILENYQEEHASEVAFDISGGDWSALMESAYSWIGTPYEYGGSSRSGVDCSGFVQAVYASQGYDIPRSSGEIYSSGTATNKPQQGDILYRPGHVGIYIDETHYIDSEQDGTEIAIREMDNWQDDWGSAVTYGGH